MVITTDPARFDFDWIHGQLSQAYWSPGVTRAIVEKAAKNSLSFATFDDNGRQIAYARVITDRTTFAYLADVIVDPAQRGRGVGKALIAHILAHAELQGLRRFLLTTSDAHGLYRAFGFQELKAPAKMMERV